MWIVGTRTGSPTIDTGSGSGSGSGTTTTCAAGGDGGGGGAGGAGAGGEVIIDAVEPSPIGLVRTAMTAEAAEASPATAADAHTDQPALVSDATSAAANA